MPDLRELHRRVLLAQMLAEQRGWAEVSAGLEHICSQLGLLLDTQRPAAKRCDSATAGVKLITTLSLSTNC